MENIKGMMKQALGIATSTKFFVKIGLEEIKEMTYLELGLFLTTNADKIEIVSIIMGD